MLKIIFINLLVRVHIYLNYSLYTDLKNQIKFLDFGANNLDNYAYLNKYIKNIDYLYHDLPSYNKFIYNFIIKIN